MKLVPLGRLAEIERDGISPEAIAPGTRYLGLEQIEAGGRILTSRAVSAGELASTKFQFGPHHLLYGKLRPYLAKIALPDFSGVCSTDIVPIRPGPDLDRRYLAHFLRQPEMVELATARSTGANLPRLSPKTLAEFEIPWRPLAEQQQIASILDRADALRSMRRRSVSRLGDLPLATLHYAFPEYPEAPLVNARREVPPAPPGASWVTLTDVARLATGHTPDRKVQAYWNGSIPWLSLTDIRALDGLEATETSQSVTQAGIDNSSSVVLPRGTVCLARTASVGFATIMGREMATSQDFVNWVCGPELEPIYLLYAILSSRSELRSLAPGSTHKTIYFPTVESFRVLLPEKKIQEHCAEVVRRYWAARQKLCEQLAVFDSLFASLQHRAFHAGL